MALVVMLGTPAQGALELSGPTPGWASPVAGEAPVMHPFLAPEHDWLAGHRGVDLGASPGALVLAPAPGVVSFSGTVVDRGVVVLLHDDGLRTSLEPVTGSVPVGTRVTQGETVGTLQGAGHCAPASCLHWGVRRGEVYLDPLSLLGAREPIVLLPLA